MRSINYNNTNELYNLLDEINNLSKHPFIHKVFFHYLISFKKKVQLFVYSRPLHKYAIAAHHGIMCKYETEDKKEIYIDIEWGKSGLDINIYKCDFYYKCMELANEISMEKVFIIAKKVSHNKKYFVLGYNCNKWTKAFCKELQNRGLTGNKKLKIRTFCNCLKVGNELQQINNYESITIEKEQTKFTVKPNKLVW